MYLRALPLLLLCLALQALSGTDTALARPPTRGHLQVGGGLIFGDPLKGANPDPYRYGIAARLGFTLNQGIYLGGMADIYLGEDTPNGDESFSNRALLAGGVLGVDLKFSTTVAGRFAVAGGLHHTSLAPAIEGSSGTDQDDLFVGPLLELVALVGDHIYFAPSARLSFVLQDEVSTLVTWAVTVGIAP